MPIQTHSPHDDDAPRPARKHPTAEEIERDDPEFNRLRRRTEVELMRRHAARLRREADDLIRRADEIEKQLKKE